jgi:predicted TIM-barrel fold metal-dependent hydrolase
LHEEPALEPGLPIIDPHLHLWDILPGEPSPIPPQRFLFDEQRAALAASGHTITHTVFVECHQMYRPDGPPELRSLGETEYVNGVAAMAATGRYGPVKIAHRIVGSADLTLGNAVARVLEAHVRAAGERFRGIRANTAYSTEGLFGFTCDPALDGVMASDAFIAGARCLAAMDLSLDVWCVHTQLPDVIALADAVPDLTIVLDHLGTPESLGKWADRREEAFAQWSGHIRELAQRENVTVKLGGLGMNLAHAPGNVLRHASSEELAAQWTPCIDTAIEAFGPHRAMFESNFPPDNDAASYGVVWNAFKRIASGGSDTEKDMLFAGTAARVYRITR